ncbi:C6 transcription factor [Aspergillus eucalypticola CBS 122712]|uniref:C6 transcription factor n=1 Tax=Aspergillus eucalypticola (strain CBS 122712 / IBT 29274) TaxID=1448314 RepID=A0A317UP72_ASPEC|nr:C6 transcription factor [Aspergillus eucalypticola CBS 122712]PWY62337.1 C6 transcription factor [Aspergillus eucalypticola CBS 122712]
MFFSLAIMFKLRPCPIDNGNISNSRMSPIRQATQAKSVPRCRPGSVMRVKDAGAIKLGAILSDLAPYVHGLKCTKAASKSRQRQTRTLAATIDNDPQYTDGNCPSTSRTERNDTQLSEETHQAQFLMEYGEAESTMGIAQKIYELDKQVIDEQSTSAIPGARTSTGVADRRAGGQRRPISSILGQRLPPTDVTYSSIEEYFNTVHWFSLVIYEPTFRTRLHSITDGFAHPSQKSFLLLLAVMLGMSAWYRSQRTVTDAADSSRWRKLSADLMSLVELHVVELMDESSVTAAQILILFGSHHVYHGRPNLSFSLLGATIKMSQAAGLHRESPTGKLEEIEERKRVWWTIYTWDRFASITYGRPLGINDKDCNLSMPADNLENPYFTAPGSEQGYAICYSPYQRELNTLYLMASPALEFIFGSRTSGSSKALTGEVYIELVKEATQNLQKWQNNLPDYLTMDFDRDVELDSGPSARAHALQSLSLQLTYDNVLIVLHRPLLARQVRHLSISHPTSGARLGTESPISHPEAGSPAQKLSPFEAMSPNEPVKSSMHWWNAALRTSRVTEVPVLAQLATDSHLVAFLAINIFHAAIVLAVMALSDPLSDSTQVAKRTITRILRLQSLLGERSALSRQSTTVLKNVVTLILRRESEAILAPVTRNSQQEGHTLSTGSASISVEDTLRLPLDAPITQTDSSLRRPTWPDYGRMHRLNESLASVQNGERNAIFLSLWDGSLQDTHGARDSQEQLPDTHEHAPAENSWHGSFENNWNDTSFPLEVPDIASDAFGDNGLYWLWDMSWAGAEP